MQKKGEAFLWFGKKQNFVPIRPNFDPNGTLLINLTLKLALAKLAHAFRPPNTMVKIEY